LGACKLILGKFIEIWETDYSEDEKNWEDMD